MLMLAGPDYLCYNLESKWKIVTSFDHEHTLEHYNLVGTFIWDFKVIYIRSPLFVSSLVRLREGKIVNKLIHTRKNYFNEDFVSCTACLTFDKPLFDVQLELVKIYVREFKGVSKQF